MRNMVIFLGIPAGLRPMFTRMASKMPGSLAAETGKRKL